MFLELFVAAALLCVGITLFGRFGEGVPRWQRLLKIAVFLGVTALLSATAGRAWAFGWIGLTLVLGLSVHAWWTRRHGIGFLSAEPWERYRELRGWTAPGARGR